MVKMLVMVKRAAEKWNLSLKTELVMVRKKDALTELKELALLVNNGQRIYRL
jgi:hypothetical protein